MTSFNSVRVRIAPSPTGNLHVGTARTALFNELYARRYNGSFVIRLEDTDPERSKAEYEENILAGLTWLGLKWNEGPDIGGPHQPYRQSERAKQHRDALQQLLDQGKAYFCDCPPKETKQVERHSCDCPQKNLTAGVIRLKVEPTTISFSDAVRGEIKVHTDSFGGDFVIARTIDEPLFHLAVVVDDASMEITHVIRGEDHLHNTIKHILIQQALGYSQPQYAHLPLLLDEQRRKLSKRSNETSLLAYRAMGILPEAMLNYLALLGWSPKNDQEIFTHDQLINEFSLESINKAGAIFSLEKLRSINKHYLTNLPAEAALKHFKEYLMLPDITEQYEDLTDEDYWKAAIQTEQPRVSTFGELAAALHFFRKDWPANYEPSALIWKKSSEEQTASILEQLINKLEGLGNDFSKDFLEKTLLAWIDTSNLGRGDTLWPMRVALTGEKNSPGPFEVAAVLGRETTLQRLKMARDKISK